jgi:hypothetical protein
MFFKRGLYSLAAKTHVNQSLYFLLLDFRRSVLLNPLFGVFLEQFLISLVFPSDNCVLRVVGFGTT